MREFRQAVESGDLTGVEELLAEHVRFTSPVVFRPYEGRAITAAILRAAFRVFEDFHYVREITGPQGHDHALVFRATVAGKVVDGCDFLHTDEAGRIDDFMVMVRPLSGAQALATAMAAQFDRIQQEAVAAAGLTGGGDLTARSR